MLTELVNPASSATRNLSTRFSDGDVLEAHFWPAWISTVQFPDCPSCRSSGIDTHTGLSVTHLPSRGGLTGTDAGGGLDLTITEQFPRSMSLDDALDPRNLLCYEMNGEPLPEKNRLPRLVWRGQRQMADAH